MNEGRPSSLGEQIRDAVQEGIVTGDFKNLNRLVNDSVSIALHEAKQRTGFEMKSGRETYQKQMQQMKDSWKYWSEQHEGNSNAYSVDPARRRSSTGEVESRGNEKFRVYFEGPGSVRFEKTKKRGLFQKKGYAGSILKRVFGGIGAFCSGITWIVFSALGLAPGIWISGLCFAIFLAMILDGTFRGKFLKRAQRYVDICGSHHYATIDDLEKGTLFSRGKILRDLRRMLQEGIFPHGHIDEKRTCLMLTDELYQQYLDAESGRIVREKEEDSAGAGQILSDQEKKDAELNQMMTEGREAVRKLRELNDAIEGEVISQKLYHLENLLNEIFDKVKQYPEKMPQMHTTMNYYLPTIIKLVEAYKEFDQVSAPGPDILSAKVEIENTLDTINEAFTELLNNLFKEKVFDVTTDAQVLQTMLAKEGLAKDGMLKGLGEETNSNEIKLEL